MGKRATGAGKIRPVVQATLATLLLSVAAPPGLAQPWRLVVDGAPASWTPPRAVPPDSHDVAAALALAHLQQEGYLLARADSVRRTAEGPVLYATPGPRATVATVTLDSVVTLDVERLRFALETRPGRPFERATLERDVASLLIAFERAGRPLTRVRPTLSFDLAAQPQVHVRFLVDEGPVLTLERLELSGARRTSARFAARLADLTPGAPLDAFDPVAIRRALEEAGIFEEVGEPSLAAGDSGGVVVLVPVREAEPGTFDLVLGYLPPSGPGRSGSFVGNGLLELRNLFGTGRLVRLRLVRNPGLVTSVEVRAADPFVLGLPLRAEGRFEGYGQDSTFSRQRYRVEGGYRVAPGLEVLAATSREVVAPGPRGARLVNGRPLVAASNAVFGGVGLRFRRVDALLNPRRGLDVEALLEQGFRRRTLPDPDSGDVFEPVSVRQQRFIAAARAYVPTLRRQVLVVGGDAAVLLGGRSAGDENEASFDEGDLFRIGGALSLRGYDENAFLGNLTGRALVEYRYQLDPTSFAFVFTDVGYVRRPAIPGFEAFEGVLPGYGFGLQYRTPLGLVTVTYALNPDIGVGQGKVHVGLSFGL